MAAPVREQAKEEEARPFAHLRATPEERERLLAGIQPFDVEAWRREAIPATPESLAALEAFLRDREEDRRLSLERDEERLQALDR
jgi:hypothetical protein